MAAAQYVLLKSCGVALETHQYLAVKMFCALMTIYGYACVLFGWFRFRLNIKRTVYDIKDLKNIMKF